MTYYELAKKAQVSISTLYRWQKHPSMNISLVHLIRVGQALELTPFELFFHIPDELTPNEKKFVELYIAATPECKQRIEKEIKHYLPEA